MRFDPLDIPGAMLIVPEMKCDERGFFARTFCREEYESHGLRGDFVQCSASFNGCRGTLRGMHWRAPPDEEVKLIRCVRGAVYDVIIDLRKQSNTFGRWLAVELSQENMNLLYVPAGVAHGFISLRDDTELLYRMTNSYRPDADRGIRWDDPDLKIDWPIKPAVISKADRSWPSFRQVTERSAEPRHAWAKWLTALLPLGHLELAEQLVVDCASHLG